MAVPGMAATEDNAVSTPLESPEHKNRINTAGTGDTYDFHIRRIIQTVSSGKVCTGVRTPVAAKSQDTGPESFRPGIGSIFRYRHIASTSAII